MTLFSAAIRRNSVSLLRFPFLSHFQVFLWEISFVVWSVLRVFSFPFLFSDYFCFIATRIVSIFSDCCNQSSSALVYVIFESFYRCINTILNACESSSTFLTLSLSTLSLGCMALCIVMNVLFFGPFVEVLLWSILRMVPSILWDVGTAQIFIPLMRFLLCSLVSSCFLVLQKYSFYFSSLVWCPPLPIFPSICKIPFFKHSVFFSWYGSSTPFVICCFLLIIISMTLFSTPNSVLIFWIYILTAG